MSSEDLAREAADPATPAARLQAIAQADRSTWHLIAANPSAYPGLLDWLGQHGDDTVRAAIASRSLTTPPPPAPVDAADHTQQLPAQQPEPTVQQPAYEHATAEQPAYAAAPLATSPAGGTGDDASDGAKKPWAALAVVGLIIALVVGGYFGVSALTGDDDDPDLAVSSQADDSKDADKEPEDDGDGDKDDFCETMKETQDSSMSMLQDMPTSPGDLEGLRETFAGLSDTYKDLEDDAPAELKDDVAVMRTFVDTVADPSGDGAAAISGQMSAYIDASTNVSTYYAANCL